MQLDHLLSLDMAPGGWHTREVAEGQQVVVERELQNPAKVEPYVAFMQAMDYLRVMEIHEPVRMLDVGCGVGHYGSLMRRWYHSRPITYYGTDSSVAMIDIARAREPDLRFDVMDFRANDFSAYNYILQSLALEMTPYPLDLLAYMLAGAKYRHIIWHRVRLAERTGFIVEPTYAGHSGPIWLWSRPDLIGYLDSIGRPSLIMPWPARKDTVTVVILPAAYHA